MTTINENLLISTHLLISTTMTLDQTDVNSNSATLKTTTTVESLMPNITYIEHPCMWILHGEIRDSRIRIWDLCILIPNVLFLLVLAIRFNRARLRLRATSSPIYSTFYALIIVNVVVSVVRCVVAMTVNAATDNGDLADKILWVIVRFFLLSTELSVIIFGLAFGHLDSRTSIQRVLFCTALISLVFSITQGVLEVITPDESFRVAHSNCGIFGHGGKIFFATNSILFFLLYVVIFLLPCTRLRERLPLPAKRSFYYYVLFLALLNLAQVVGSGMLFYRLDGGLCIIDIASLIYFGCFTPLVYKTFLSDSLGITQPSIMFSYKAQVDEVVEEDTVSLPHQLSCSSLKTDSDYIYQNNSLYDSTQFEASTPVNPLYAHSLQSPDSIAGYNMSRSNSLNSDPGYQQHGRPMGSSQQPLH